MSGVAFGFPFQASRKAAATLVNGATLFTVTGGMWALWALGLLCETANDGTASTIQFSHTPSTGGSAKTISAASASIASAAAGATLTLNRTSLATAPDLVTAANGGVAVQASVGNYFQMGPGTITIVVGVGSTTGTWSAHMAWVPMAPGVVVV